MNSKRAGSQPSVQFSTLECVLMSLTRLVIVYMCRDLFFFRFVLRCCIWISVSRWSFYTPMESPWRFSVHFFRASSHLELTSFMFFLADLLGPLFAVHTSSLSKSRGRSVVKEGRISASRCLFFAGGKSAARGRSGPGFRTVQLGNPCRQWDQRAM